MSTIRDIATDGKSEVISFKVDSALAQAMRGVENRSAFIRAAVLCALDNSCPMCGGAGVLSAAQKRHWDHFLRDHEMRQCSRCRAFHPICKPSSRGASLSPSPS